MKTRLTAVLLLAALGDPMLGSAAHADLNIFGGYWENVARAASQNDKMYSLIATGAVRSVRLGRSIRVPVTALTELVNGADSPHS